MEVALDFRVNQSFDQHGIISKLQVSHGFYPFLGRGEDSGIYLPGIHDFRSVKSRGR